MTDNKGSMADIKGYKTESFCWVELGTTEPQEAKSFYQKILNWTWDDKPIGSDFYTMLQLDGKDVAGLYQLTSEQKVHGVPPHWLSYVLVESSDETTKKAKQLGATILKEPFDVMEVGRMSVVQDPTGASFATWQPKAHAGAAALNNVPGSCCWNELLTKDVEKATRFYSQLFKWTPNVQDFGGNPYTIMINGDKMACGLMATPEDWGQVPPFWMVYFAVSDCDSISQTISESGGKILVPPMDIPTVGRFSTVNDPQGAVFSIIKLNDK